MFTEYVSHNSWPNGLKAPQSSCEPIFLHKHKLHTGAQGQVRTCPRTPQCSALFGLSAQTGSPCCGERAVAASPQTRGSFLCSLPGNRAGSCHFKGSSPVQTPGYEQHIPWALVTLCRGLACVHTGSIKVNKCTKALPLGLNECIPTGRSIYRGRGRTAGQLPSSLWPSGVALGAIAKPSWRSRPAERLVWSARALQLTQP